MPKERLIGIWLVAAYFLAKAAFLGAVVLTAIRDVSARSDSIGTIDDLLPLLRRLDTGPGSSLAFAALFVVFGAAVGVCLLTRQKWAAAYVVAFHGIALVWFLLASLGLHFVTLQKSPDALSSPYAKYEIVASLLMVAYLLQPRVMRAFGFSEGD